jgi:hypothetical protein
VLEVKTGTEARDFVDGKRAARIVILVVIMQTNKPGQKRLQVDSMKVAIVLLHLEAAVKATLTLMKLIDHTVACVPSDTCMVCKTKQVIC